MIIRAANRGDAEGIASVHVHTWRACYKGIVPDAYLDSLSIKGRIPGWEKELDLNAQSNYVVENNQGIVGWVTSGSNRDGRSKEVYEIYGIYVLPEYWGASVGLMLLEAARKSLRQLEPSIITLWVLKENVRARKFYKKNGFTEDGAGKIINIGGADLEEIRYEQKTK